MREANSILLRFRIALRIESLNGKIARMKMRQIPIPVKNIFISVLCSYFNKLKYLSSLYSDLQSCDLLAMLDLEVRWCRYQMFVHFASDFIVFGTIIPMFIVIRWHFVWLLSRSLCAMV